MARIDDVNKLYCLSKRIQSFMKILFYINVICAILSCILRDNNIIESLFVIQIIVSIIYVSLNILDENFFWYNAESVRRKTSIENGFGIDITEYKTKEYYNNKLPKSIMKYSLNCFESILYSKKTAEKMLWGQSVKSTIALVTFICLCLMYKDYSVILIVSQTVFSAYFIKDFITLINYKIKLEEHYKAMYRELITIGISNENQKWLLLYYAIEYEAIKAHYKVILSEKIFKKHKDATDLKWKEIYEKISIKD